MPMKHILFKQLNPYAITPARATYGSAGYDLYASENSVVYKGQRKKISTGIAIHIYDTNYAGVILPRSGLGSKGIILANTVGLIDSDYQGELIVNLWNTSDEPFAIERGLRIAQLVFIPVATPIFLLEKEDFKISARGTGGFGSTG